MAGGDATRSRELAAELERLEEGQASALPALAGRLLGYLGADQALCYVLAPNEPPTLEQCHARGLRPGFEQRFAAFLRGAPRRFGLYDPLRPEPWQRNRPLREVDFPDPDGRWQLPFFKDLVPSEGIAPSFVRLLVCEGGELLGWVGAFREGPFDERERRLLGALAPALRRRLRFERAIGGTALQAAALPAVLDAIAGAAFLLGPRGSLQQANRLGEGLLQRDAKRLRATLRALAEGAPARRPWSVQRVRCDGVPDHFLAVRRFDQARLDDRVIRAGLRWGLSPKVERVLARLARGESNRAIAKRLGYAEGTVELYVSKILARAGAEGRAALLAKLFTEG